MTQAGWTRSWKRMMMMMMMMLLKIMVVMVMGAGDHDTYKDGDMVLIN